MKSGIFHGSLFKTLRTQSCLFNCTKYGERLLKISGGCLSSKRTVMELSIVRKVLEEIAPLSLAEDWDNVGLLIEPTAPRKVSQILLTIDLTEDVLHEALQKQVELIVSYHPPIFRPMKSLRTDKWKDRIVLKCAENSIAVYSPHTALDSVEGGINDWLLQCFDCKIVLPLKSVFPSTANSIKLDGKCSPEHYKMVISEFFPSMKILDYSFSEDTVFGTILANEADMAGLYSLVTKEKCFTISGVHRQPVNYSGPVHGSGRRTLLREPIKISEAVEKVKKFLNLQNLRISMATGCTTDSLVQSIAVCAGSGGEVLSGVKADLLLTGEMSHHALLDAAHRGSTVILTEHSNSERFYLHHLAQVLSGKLAGVTVVCSKCDRDPILIV